MAPKMSRYACGACSEDCKSQGLLCEVSNFKYKITMKKKKLLEQANYFDSWESKILPLLVCREKRDCEAWTKK